MIAYVEMGDGLHDAIRKAGYSLRQENGIWVSSDDAAVQAIIDAYDPLAESITIVKAQIDCYAKDMRDRAIATFSAGEMASWPIKRAESMMYASTGLDSDAPMLLTEAQARGISLSALAAKVEANSAIFSTLEARIAGACGKHRDTVSAMTDFNEVLGYDFKQGWPV